MAEAFADLVSDLSKLVDVFDEFEKYAGTTTTGLIATTAAAKNTLTGDEGQRAIPAIDGLIDLGGAMVSTDAIRSAVEPVVFELARSTEIDRAAANIQAAWEALYDYCADTPRHVVASGDTYDTSFSAGASNVGTGSCYRLTVDENGFTLAGIDPDAYTVECMADARTTGRAHDEDFEIRGTAGRLDNLDLTGTNLEGLRFKGLTASAGLLRNGSFDQATYSGSTISAMAGWRTATDGASAVPNSNIEIDATNAFRTTPGNTNSYGLKFTADETVYQDVVVENNARVDLNAPHMIWARVRRNGSATGNVTLRLSGTLGSGGVSATVALSSITADTWTTLVIAVGADSWPANWNANDLKFQVKVDTLATSTVTIDDCGAVPMTRFGAQGNARTGRGSMGQYVCYLGGQTPSKKGDTYTVTDSEGTRGVVNYWLRKAGLGYLPSAAAATEVTAAGGRTLTFADADPDTITASSGSFVSDGYKAGMNIVVAGSSSNNGTFLIATVAATVITLDAAETLAAEGPVSATATLNASAYIPDP